MAEHARLSTQLKVQLTIMLTAVVIGAAVFVYTFGFDKWRGPLARREYYELGDHNHAVQLPEFARVTPTPQAIIGMEGMDSGETSETITAATQELTDLQPDTQSKPGENR
jgi:hypothetical protein